MKRHLLVIAALFAAVALASCGGGGSGSAPAQAAPPADNTPPATNPPATNPPASNPPATVPPPDANILAMTVDRGLDGTALNSPFVTVTVCVPGTATCQTVDHVLVDTGSFGLRLSASVLSAALSLPGVNNAAGLPVAECAHFATGFTWGPVRRADVKLAGETAAALPIQIVGDTAAPFATVPSACSNTGANFGADLGAKGILGVGVFNQDCPACTSSAAPGVYFTCASSGCSATTLPLALQVANPVPSFAVDNNGLALVLPSVPVGGVESLSGSMIFGIGTQSNNQLGSATVYATNAQGNFTTVYKGASFPSSFLDSGSNGIFFRDTAIPQCSGFYCPANPLFLSAVNTSASGVSGTVSFTIESIQSIGRNVAAANIGGDVGLPRAFDWGLPFFFGRKVFLGISGASTPGGTGPYWAY